jgi:hypothetical protein
VAAARDHCEKDDYSKDGPYRSERLLRLDPW